MFGFVTFIDPQTVKTILDKGNLHYVRESRVLVKPYREKSKVIERKYADRIQHSMCYSPHHIDIDSEMNSIPRSCGDVRSLMRQLMEEQEQALEPIEMQRRRLAALQFAQNSVYFTPFLLLHKWNENFRRSFQFQLSSSRIFQKHPHKEI
ncbi:hypothetical protein S245_017690 [Arachis hypogaea]|uniref:RRM domain-containing protein n=1 Tax=Arachis hypogaea TaxID=3818 RepID=A0A445D1H2_ARAHY|nr:hypothetical protein Ahy_A05g022789 [Arachis hypogaea]